MTSSPPVYPPNPQRMYTCTVCGKQHKETEDFMPEPKLSCPQCRESRVHMGITGTAWPSSPRKKKKVTP